MDKGNKIKATAEDLRTFVRMRWHEYDPVTGELTAEMLDRLHAFTDVRDWFTTIFVENGKEGLKDLDGSIMVPAIFDKVSTFDRKLYGPAKSVVVMLGGKYGITQANGKGEMLLACEHENICDVYDRFIITDNGKSGLFVCDTMVVPQIADRFFEPCYDVFKFVANGKFGMYDVVCEVYFEPVYDDIELFPDEIIKVVYQGKVGFLHIDGYFVPAEEADPKESFNYMKCFDPY